MSLSGQYDDNNIFAKIIRGEAPAVKVYEDEAVLAFMDVFPQSKGHCLVISKTDKARNLLEIDPQALGSVMGTVQTLAKAVATALNPDGVVITQFNGAPAGQTVFHLHVHIIPRYANLPLQPHHGGKPADIDVLREQAARIAAAL